MSRDSLDQAIAKLVPTDRWVGHPRAQRLASLFEKSADYAEALVEELASSIPDGGTDDVELALAQLAEQVNSTVVEGLFTNIVDGRLEANNSYADNLYIESGRAIIDSQQIVQTTFEQGNVQQYYWNGDSNVSTDDITDGFYIIGHLLFDSNGSRYLFFGNQDDSDYIPMTQEQLQAAYDATSSEYPWVEVARFRMQRQTDNLILHQSSHFGRHLASNSEGEVRNRDIPIPYDTQLALQFLANRWINGLKTVTSTDIDASVTAITSVDLTAGTATVSGIIFEHDGLAPITVIEENYNIDGDNILTPAAPFALNEDSETRCALALFQHGSDEVRLVSVTRESGNASGIGDGLVARAAGVHVGSNLTFAPNYVYLCEFTIAVSGGGDVSITSLEDRRRTTPTDIYRD